MTHMNGHYNREIEANGPTGIMVLRMRMPYMAPTQGLAGCSPNSRGGVRDARSNWEELLFTLRRSRGAAGRYQGTTAGAAWAAAGERRVPRRPTDGSDGCPGAGKGLKVFFHREIHTSGSRG